MLTLVEDPGLLISGEDSLRDRMTVERERMVKRYPHFRFETARGAVKLVEGILNTNYGSPYVARIVVPGKYPYAIPSLRFPHERFSPHCPHRYSDGSLCVMKHDQWRSMYSLAYMVMLAGVWAQKYDSWKRTGEWPGLEQNH